MGLFDYFLPPVSPVPGPNQSQFGKDFSSAIFSGANKIGGVVNQGLLNFSNLISSGKTAKNYPNSFQKPAVQQANQAVASSQPITTPTPAQKPPVWATPTPTPTAAPQQNFLTSVTQEIARRLSRPTPTPMPTATPQPTPTPAYSPRQQQIDTIQQFYKNWGGAPAATLAAEMVDQSQKYPILQQHPEYLPITSILESGGMKNMISKTVTGRDKNNNVVTYYPNNENRQYNGFGWGFPFD